LINITDKLKNKINQISELPGIYKMLDAKSNIIYIGKSKSIRKRVKTYFSNNPKWEKVKEMVLLIDDIEFEVTDTHVVRINVILSQNIIYLYSCIEVYIFINYIYIINCKTSKIQKMLI